MQNSKQKRDQQIIDHQINQQMKKYLSSKQEENNKQKEKDLKIKQQVYEMFFGQYKDQSLKQQENEEENLNLYLSLANSIDHSNIKNISGIDLLELKREELIKKEQKILLKQDQQMNFVKQQLNKNLGYDQTFGIDSQILNQDQNDDENLSNNDLHSDISSQHSNNTKSINDRSQLNENNVSETDYQNLDDKISQGEEEEDQNLDQLTNAYVQLQEQNYQSKQMDLFEFTLNQKVQMPKFNDPRLNLSYDDNENNSDIQEDQFIQNKNLIANDSQENEVKLNENQINIQEDVDQTITFHHHDNQNLQQQFDQSFTFKKDEQKKWNINQQQEEVLSQYTSQIQRDDPIKQQISFEINVFDEMDQNQMLKKQKLFEQKIKKMNEKYEKISNQQKLNREEFIQKREEQKLDELIKKDYNQNDLIKKRNEFNDQRKQENIEKNECCNIIKDKYKYSDKYQKKKDENQQQPFNLHQQQQLQQQSIIKENYSKSSGASQLKDSNGENKTKIQRPLSYKPQESPQIQSNKQFQKPSNKQRIKMAINQVCLAGVPNKKERELVFDFLIQSQVSQYIIVFKTKIGRQDFKGLYQYDTELDILKKLYVTGIDNQPDVITSDMVFCFYRYDTSNKEFKSITSTKSFSLAIDAITLLSNK